MIGESYFNLKDYSKALSYLQKANLNPQGNYVIGYCYYKLNDCAKAVSHFEKATVDKDSLAQSAWYHMADCYIKLNDKTKAKNAFYGAYQVGLKNKISEDALFSFARLSYELDFNPYNESVKSFTKYLKEYPDSPRKDEVYKFLVVVYSTTKNYDQALKSIESLEAIDPILKVTYQKLLYFRGIEFFNNGDLVNAEKFFKKSMAQNSDVHLNSLTQYWLAEISYLRKDYTTAIDSWKKFQTTQGAPGLREYSLSNYDLGYAYFQRKEKEDYTNANISFRKYLLTNSDPENQKTADATIRTADCYFMNRDFLQAAEYYKKAIDLNKMDMDYALFQKALCDGLNKNYTQKIEELKKLESRYPQSNYLSAALNEIADTYFNNLHQDDNAIVYYERILKNYPNSSFVNNCYAQLGNIFFNRKQDDKAFEYYDKFVKNDRQSEASKEVLQSIKKIFEAKGDVEGMKNYFESVGNPLSENELEKITYTTAYDAYYNQKNCDDAMPKWESYISKFPNGKYILEAQFNNAECAYSKDDYAKALTGYQFVISKSRSTYSEISLTKASYILFKDKKYDQALPLYQQLQDIAETPANKSSGRIGAMRCAFYLANYTLALDECTKVLNTEKLTPQQISEARYIKARSLYETNRHDDALTELKTIAKSAKNSTGAEAYYYMAKIYFAKQDYKEVEKTINKLVSYEYSNDDWNNKGMLLLADSYIAKGEIADAKVTLETIIESKPKAEYEELARKKLQEINAKEAEEKALQNAPPPSGPNSGDLQIDYEQQGKEQQLFDQEQTSPVTTPTNTNQPK
jgi:tetratricopeptide (TPR) repeat protein